MPQGNVAKGIDSKFTGSAFETAIGAGKLYREEAPQDASLPYCVFNFISTLNNDTFTEDMEYHHIQFTIWTNNLNPDTATTGLDALILALRTLYDGVILTVTSWTNLNLRWISERPAISKDNQVIGSIIEYETYITKSK
jgi:hypothetical protein